MVSTMVPVMRAVRAWEVRGHRVLTGLLVLWFRLTGDGEVGRRRELGGCHLELELGKNPSMMAPIPG
jgi:hypothetical protein